jgi:hypothetical protein
MKNAGSRKALAAGIWILLLATAFWRAAADAVGPSQGLSMDLNRSFTRADTVGEETSAFEVKDRRLRDVLHG